MKRGARRFGRRVVRRGGFKTRRLIAKTRNAATVTEQVQEKGQPYNVGTIRGFSLNPTVFERASAVALNYRFYRLKKVTYIYIPKYNIFPSGLVDSPSMPQLWTLRAKYAPATGVDPLEGTGALPFLEDCGARSRMFSKKLTVSYTPNLFVPLLVDPTNPSAPITSKPAYNTWVPTQLPNSPGSSANDNIPQVVYFGHYDYVQQDLTATAPDTFDLEIRLTWEFKDPMVPNLSP